MDIFIWNHALVYQPRFQHPGIMVSGIIKEQVDSAGLGPGSMMHLNSASVVSVHQKSSWTFSDGCEAVCRQRISGTEVAWDPEGYGRFSPVRDRGKAE